MDDTPENRAAIGARIGRVRRDAGFTNAAEFARRVGVQPNTLYRWERGEIAPDIFRLESIAKVGKVSTDWILRGVVSPSSREILLQWYETPKGKAASPKARLFIESLQLEGYVPSFGFFDLALIAYEQGLTAEEAATAARVTRTAGEIGR